jgi:hypothetical protein
LHFEQIDLRDWLSENPSSTVIPDLPEFFARSFTKLNIRNARAPDNIRYGSLYQGIDIICGLLRLLVTSIFTKSTISSAAMKRDVITVLDQNQRLWNVLTRASDCYPKAEKQSSHLVEHVFQGLQELVLYLSQPQWQSSVRHKVHCLWAQRISEMVDISHASHFSIMADDITSILGITIDISPRAPGLASTVYAILQPTVKGVVDEKAAQSITYTKIQVRQKEFSVAI